MLDGCSDATQCEISETAEEHRESDPVESSSWIHHRGPGIAVPVVETTEPQRELLDDPQSEESDDDRDPDTAGHSGQKRFHGDPFLNGWCARKCVDTLLV